MYPNDDFPAADNNKSPGGKQADDAWAKRFAPAPGTGDPRIAFYEMGRAAGRAEMELARVELARVDEAPHLGRSAWPALAAVLLAVMGSFSVGRITAPTIGNDPIIGNLAFNGAATDSPQGGSAAMGTASPDVSSSNVSSPRDDATQSGTRPNATAQTSGVSNEWALPGWLFGFQDTSAASENSVLVARQNVEWAGPIDQPPYRLTAHRQGNAPAAHENLPPTAPSSDRNAILQRSDLLDPQFDWNQWFQGRDG